FRGYCFAFLFKRSGFNLKQYFGSAVPAHYGKFGTRPSHNQSWIISFSTHSVVSCTVTVSYYYCELWHYAVAHSIYHFGTVLNDTPVLAFAAHHKTSYVLKKHEWNFLLVAVCYKSCGFICT